MDRDNGGSEAGRPGVAGIHSVGVIGGGTAGYFAALALKKRFPDLDVTIVESKSIPVIGVGEASTTLMPPFLHAQLGLDIVELFDEVRPTLKLGIKFDWGLPGDSFYTYPFGETSPVAASAFDGDLRTQSLTSLLMISDRSPIVREPSGAYTSLLPRLKFAYHLDNAPFVRFLAKNAALRGIAHIDAIIDAVVTASDGNRVEALRTRDGRELRFDLYIDASGFRSLLLEKALGSPFESFESSLFCDTAVVAAVPAAAMHSTARAVVQPYTTAETMDAGWCWRIPVEREDHRGYVHASAFLSTDEAVAEMRAKNPGMGEPSIVHFRSGRHRDFWKGNVVAVGNAYGFVEPLESTALHMVIVEIAYLVATLEAAAEAEATQGTKEIQSGATPDPTYANAGIGAHWDYLRWFLALHYKFNRKLDTKFWRACRADVDVTGLQAAIDRFGEQGPWSKQDGTHFQVGDPAFGYEGVMITLLGQQVDGPVTAPRSTTKEAWASRIAAQRDLVARALPQAEALALFREQPEILFEFAASPRSWCQGPAERVAVSIANRTPAQPMVVMPAYPSPYEHLLISYR